MSRPGMPPAAEESEPEAEWGTPHPAAGISESLARAVLLDLAEAVSAAGTHSGGVADGVAAPGGGDALAVPAGVFHQALNHWSNMVLLVALRSVSIMRV